MVTKCVLGSCMHSFYGCLGLSPSSLYGGNMTKEQLLDRITALKALPCTNELLFPDHMTVRQYKQTMLSLLLIDYALEDNDISVAVDDFEASI